MNKFQFLGRLTKDPEVRYTANTNSQVTVFPLAVNRRFASQNGERQTDFFNLTAFGKTAEFCSKYYKKGQQVLSIKWNWLIFIFSFSFSFFVPVPWSVPIFIILFFILILLIINFWKNKIKKQKDKKDKK